MAACVVLRPFAFVMRSAADGRPSWLLKKLNATLSRSRLGRPASVLLSSNVQGSGKRGSAVRSNPRFQAGVRFAKLRWRSSIRTRRSVGWSPRMVASLLRLENQRGLRRQFRTSRRKDYKGRGVGWSGAPGTVPSAAERIPPQKAALTHAAWLAAAESATGPF